MAQFMNKEDDRHNQEQNMQKSFLPNFKQPSLQKRPSPSMQSFQFMVPQRKHSNKIYPQVIKRTSGYLPMLGTANSINSAEHSQVQQLFFAQAQQLGDGTAYSYFGNNSSSFNNRMGGNTAVSDSRNSIQRTLVGQNLFNILNQNQPNSQFNFQQL